MTNTMTCKGYAALTHELPRDWALEGDYTHHIREEEATPRATSDTVYLELRRTFDWRP